MPYALRTFGAPVWYGGNTSAPVGVMDASHYRGSTSPVPLVLPAFFPLSSWYAVGGVTLDDQPTICTAPVPQGKALRAGSLFALLFQSPSAHTQVVLPNGATVQMTFPLFGGAIVTGQVQLASTLTGSVFQVICTILTDIPVG